MRNRFGTLYSKYKNIWGDKPNKLLLSALQYLDIKKEVLDLGCGQGRDALFLSSLGFTVTAVDSSQEGIEIINIEAKNRKLKLNTTCQRVENFKVQSNKYGLIQLNNVLHFLSYDDGLKVLKNVKDKIIANGIVVVSNFTIFDESKLLKKGQFFVGKNQLASLFSDFEVLFYEEKTFHNNGHKGDETPHSHHIAKIIARKSVN